jgi:hypothetical protein
VGRGFLISGENTGWRTMLVVPELDFELEMLVHTFSIRKVGPKTGFMKTSDTWVGSKVLESPLLAVSSWDDDRAYH